MCIRTLSVGVRSMLRPLGLGIECGRIFILPSILHYVFSGPALLPHFYIRLVSTILCRVHGTLVSNIPLILSIIAATHCF
jgi:hypothetical protein